MAMKNILFLGCRNAARTVMAEAYANHAGRGYFRAFSAGTAPAGAIDLHTLDVLRDAGIRPRSLSSKSWELFALSTAPRMDLIVTLCDEAFQHSPDVWPGTPQLRHWTVPDPAEEFGSPAHLRSAYIECLAALRLQIDALLSAEPPLGLLMEHAARGEVVG